MASVAGWERPSMAGESYTRVAIFLHWAIALCILYNLTSGLLGAFLPGWFFALHVSSGLTILLLSIVRVIWRLTHKPPPMLPMAAWERTLAHLVHFLLYAAILIVPFSGWAMISASPPIGSPGAVAADAQRGARAAAAGRPAPGPRRPQMFWGIAPVPLLGPLQEIGRLPEGVAEQREKHEQIETFHAISAWSLLVLAILHIAGALKHQLVDRVPELARMGVGAEKRGEV